MTISVSWFLQLLVFTLSCSSILARIQSAPKVSGELSRPESDLVTNLPGQPAVNFKHFAGYVKLRKEDEKALFYWFFEAQDHVAERPIVLWLNGGPGCSSVAYGAAQELGPFLARNNDSNLVLNKFSWNKAANLLFLEAPVGVGYSYTNNSADLNNLGDKVTAEDSHAFLVEWFKKFPKFKSHEFYIAGESYAGHYVPQLAELVYDRNKGASKDTVINFKGFMIGNAVLNDDTDELGIFEFAWSHAIISDQIYHSITSNCDFRKYNQTTICKLSIHNFSQALYCVVGETRGLLGSLLNRDHTLTSSLSDETLLDETLSSTPQTKRCTCLADNPGSPEGMTFTCITPLLRRDGRHKQQTTITAICNLLTTKASKEHKAYTWFLTKLGSTSTGRDFSNPLSRNEEQEWKHSPCFSLLQ
ncbi:hypothetical protein ACHQM5_005154 [Ranunculus cassubicifolius]